jgi:hypothetical protein
MSHRDSPRRLYTLRRTTPRAPHHAGVDGEGGSAILGAPGAAHAHQGLPAGHGSGRALPACTIQRLCVRIRAVCSGGAPLDCGHRPGSGSGCCKRCGLGASALAYGRSPDRRPDRRPAGGQALARQPARGGATRPRPDCARFQPGRRADRLRARKPVAAIVYRRGGHLINLFVAQGAEAERAARVATMQGVNVDLWSEKGLNLCAVGDVSTDELEEFRKKFEAVAWAARI